MINSVVTIELASRIEIVSLQEGDYMSIVFEYIDRLEAAISMGHCDDDLIKDTVSTFSDLEGIKKGLDRYRGRVSVIGSVVTYDNLGDARKLRDKLRRYVEENGIKRDYYNVPNKLKSPALTDIQMLKDEAARMLSGANPYSVESGEFSAWKARVSRLFDKYPQLAPSFKNQIESISFATEYCGTDDAVPPHAVEDFRRGMEASIACLDAMIAECGAESWQFETSISDSDVPDNGGKVFIVHGRDDAARHEVKMLLQEQSIQPVVLVEQANIGMTIIEKLEENSDVHAAVLLMTADDEGRLCGENNLQLRARQNVVFEAGLFIGGLGRNRVVLIVDSGIELPSDIVGIGYIERKEGWKMKLLKELKGMGFAVDANRLL